MRCKTEQVCHFSSLSRFCLGLKTISRRAARQLIVLRPKENIESEKKFCSKRCQQIVAGRQLRG